MLLWMDSTRRAAALPVGAAEGDLHRRVFVQQQREDACYRRRLARARPAGHHGQAATQRCGSYRLPVGSVVLARREQFPEQRTGGLRRLVLQPWRSDARANGASQTALRRMISIEIEPPALDHEWHRRLAVAAQAAPEQQRAPRVEVGQRGADTVFPWRSRSGQRSQLEAAVAARAFGAEHRRGEAEEARLLNGSERGRRAAGE